jgi:hypothetical protein
LEFRNDHAAAVEELPDAEAHWFSAAAACFGVVEVVVLDSLADNPQVVAVGTD